jgi:hypothetical protein
MRKWIAGILCGAALLGVASFAGAPMSVRTLDLSTLAAYRDASTAPGIRKDSLGITFADDSTIFVSAQFEFWPESGGKFSIKTQHASYNTAVLSVDVQTGTSHNAQVWQGWEGSPAILDGSKIHSSGNSGCLVAIGNQLLSLSHTLDVVATRDLQLNRVQFNGYPQQDQWTLLTDSRSRRALLVRFPFTPEETTQVQGDAHWISVDTLEDQSSFSVRQWDWSGAAIVGDAVVFNELRANHQPASIQVNDEEPRPLCADCFGGVEGTFGSGLIFLRGQNQFWVTDSSGAILYHEKGIGGKADTIGGVTGAVTSNRVAYVFGHLGRRLENTIIVLDMDAKKEVWHLDLHMQPVTTQVGGLVKESFPSTHLAISPNGRTLAIVSGTVLSMYEIP